MPIPAHFAEWTTEYINSLPDAAFAVIEPAYKRGDTEDKRCRHLPHHSDGVTNGNDSGDHVDMDHLRNAWQRRKQIKPVSDSISQEELISRAEKHLKKHIRDLDLAWADSEEASRVRFDPGENEIELIPGQFSLSRTGEGMIRLIAPFTSKPTQTQTEKKDQGQGSDKTGTAAAGAAENADAAGFFHARFRALSKIYIEDYACDFSKEGVLENAVPLLKNQTVYADHYVSVHNWLGVVENSLWDDKSEPPGIDADIKIDAALNPKIVRGLSIQPPAIHSASVTVFFLWSKSHPDMDDDEFWDGLGEEKDGETVRIIVDEITLIGELSLVWQGADPYAKRKLQKRALSKKGGQMPNDPKEISELKKLQEQFGSLKMDLAQAQEAKKTVDEELAALKPKALLGEKYLESLRAETEARYRLLNAGRVNEEYVKLMIHDAPADHLQVLNKDYEELLAAKLFVTCPHCGKEIKSLRRSVESVKADEAKPDAKQAEQHKV